MPISRATARRESHAAPPSARCRRAVVLISSVSSARTRARAETDADSCFSAMRSMYQNKSSALDNSADGIQHGERNESSALDGEQETRMSETRYIRPGSFTKHGFNRFVRRLARMGVSVAGSRELRIVGRKSGEMRSVVVNLLDLDGTKYLVSPRGHTEWVRNLRAAGG